MSSTLLEMPHAETRGVDYVERARCLAPMLKEAADEIEERRELPEQVVQALIEGGFFKLLIPRSLGGAELPPLTYVQVLEEIGKAEPSTAWSLGQNSGCSMSAPYLDPAVAREIFGPPRGILAWGPELPGAGRSVAAEGGIRVTGRWGFATGSRHATWLGAHVPGVRAGRHAAHEPERAAACPHRPLPEIKGRDNRQLAGHRIARHRQRQLPGR